MKYFPILILSALLLSCAQTKTVTVTEYRDRVLTDTVTIMAIDSVYISHIERMKGDTVHVRDTIFKFKILHDNETKTEYIRDSIPYPVEVVKEVRKRNGYDRFTSWGFWIFVVLILIRVGWWIFKTFYLHKR